MYRIMVVDDEPPIIRSVKRTIQKSSRNFEIVAEAYNGMEALDKIPSAKPDIVFTDIKMPVMDGITLIKKLNESYPQILPVIISGYQDFEYVRAALKASVVDYLLKPLEPESVRELLSIMERKLDELYISKGSELLQLIVNSTSVDSELKDHYLNFDCFSTILTRIGALPSRFSSPYPQERCMLVDPLYIKHLKLLFNISRLWFLDGKDENETLIVIGFSGQPSIDPEIIAQDIHTKLAMSSRFLTTIFVSGFFKLLKLPDIAQNMFNVLNRKLVIGKSQLIDINKIPPSDAKEPPILSSNLENKIAFLVENKSMEALKNELLKLFSLWEADAYPQVWVEKMLKQIFRIIEKRVPCLDGSLSINIERQLEDVLACCVDFGGILRGVWDIIEDVLTLKAANDNRKDLSLELINRIDLYINTNLANPLTLQGVCEFFGVSQPYLSRIFRKYKNTSFNEYITNLRINEAKRLLSEHPDMHMKDIAEIVGYQDQHYFSRVFKAVTGVSPSEYK